MNSKKYTFFEEPKSDTKSDRQNESPGSATSEKNSHNAKTHTHTNTQTQNRSSTSGRFTSNERKALKEFIKKFEDLDKLPGLFSKLQSEFGLLQIQMNQITMEYQPITVDSLFSYLIESGKSSMVSDYQIISQVLEKSLEKVPRNVKRNASFQANRIKAALEMILTNYKIIPK